LASPPQSGVREADRVRVLIVDEDFDSAEILSVVLTQEGFDVQVALEASAALTIIDDFVPDVAIVDIGLPGVNGYELAAALRAKPELSACRFIAVSGYVADRMSELSAKAGFEAHLTKPIRHNDLLRILRDAAPNQARRS
jgi:two-component system, sensor histidine kinase